jgi:hypothetical protein
MNAGSKKIDVDELRQKIVDTMKGGNRSTLGNAKYSTGDISQSMISNNYGGNTKGKSNARNTRSKSPGNNLGNINGMSFDEVPERGSAVKGGNDQSINNRGDAPVWYNVLKKNLK